MKKTDSKIIESILKDYENNIKIIEISKKYNIHQRQIYKFVAQNNLPSRRGFKIRKYLINENLFLNANDEETIYWLGFLMADGWIQSKYALGLSLKDGDMIYKFRKFIGNENIPIKNAKNCKGVLNQKRIMIHSSKIINNLKKYGIVKNKSKITKIINIPLDLINHFIRGYFDGDGHIYENKKNRDRCMGITSCSKEILLQIQEILKYNNIIKDKNYITNRKNNKCSDLRIRSKIEIINFGNFIYKNSTIYLDRKYQKFLNIKN